MRRIDIRVYVDDEAVYVNDGDIERLAKTAAEVVKQTVEKSCKPHCPEGFITVMTHIEDDVDYMTDMYI